MKQYLDQTVAAISESIRFNSSLTRAVKNAPFGTGARDCLQHFLSLAESLGFETCNYDNFAGEVLFGSGEGFAILAHLDVVPAGSGWSVAPFGGVVSQGKIWGRGATDDKGPAIACLFALKALKDEGFVPKRRIHLIVGCNEESGWRCIARYKRRAAMPEIGFSPDAEFPVIYAEKGILHLRFHFPIPDAPFFSLSGGSSANMVCDRCLAVVDEAPNRMEARSHGVMVTGRTLMTRGKSAHASTPEEGENAIRTMLEYFARTNRDVAEVVALLFEDKLGLTELCDETGRLTISPDTIYFRNGELQIVCDIRYPATFTVKDVLQRIDVFRLRYECMHHQPPLYVDKDDPLVRTLLSVYSECTGVQAEPVAIGGGTYARALRHGVAFGPEIPGENCGVHQPDEFISIERVELLLNVYKRAIERLTG